MTEKPLTLCDSVFYGQLIYGIPPIDVLSIISFINIKFNKYSIVIRFCPAQGSARVMIPDHLPKSHLNIQSLHTLKIQLII